MHFNIFCNIILKMGFIAQAKDTEGNIVEKKKKIRVFNCLEQIQK